MADFIGKDVIHGFFVKSVEKVRRTIGHVLNYCTVLRVSVGGPFGHIIAGGCVGVGSVGRGGERFGEFDAFGFWSRGDRHRHREYVALACVDGVV